MPKLPADAVRLLEADFTVRVLPAAQPRGAVPAEWAQEVRAIATPGRDPGGGRLDAALLDQLPRLEVISSFSSGLDGIDVEAVKARGIALGHAPDVLAEPVADIALALAIDVARGMTRGDRYVRAGHWSRLGPMPLARSLGGKAAGILGLGRIGKALARRLVACGLQVAYTGRRPQAGVPYRHVSTLHELARASDFLFCCCPATPQTLRIVDASVLKALGPEGILVNVARGAVVDEDALIQALRDGTIAGAGLDVCENEPEADVRFLTLDNLVILPHLGASTTQARAQMFEVMRDNLLRYFAGQALRHPYGQD